MSTIAVVNAIDLAPAATRPLGGGPSALVRALAAARMLPGKPGIVLLASSHLAADPDVRVAHRNAWTTSDLLSALADAGAGHEDIFYYYADFPLLDPVLAARLHASHRRYFAEYTFADGWPAGLAPEIVRCDAVPRMQALAAGSPALGAAPVARDALFAVIQKDINAFDVETELAPRDQRMLRATLAADGERNARVVEALLARGATDAESVAAALEAEPRILRTLPAFFNVQVVAACPQSCSYCPWPVVAGDPRRLDGFMPVETFDGLLGRIEDFAHDAHVSISLWGDPSRHPDAAGLVKAAAHHAGIRLVIETSGVGWRPGTLAEIAAAISPTTASAAPPTWIVSLDAASAAIYEGLRGSGFAEASATAAELMKLFPSSTHLQAVRMKENEEDLETFYRDWKQRTERVIIQKYDSFAGVLPDRKVADLSPLRRFPCWHLRRDVAILLDGTVPLCREDLRAAGALGNAFTDDLAVIWERGARQYDRHIAGDLPDLCAGCDEYYTFNF
jgi:spiro-SPASM protein